MRYNLDIEKKELILTIFKNTYVFDIDDLNIILQDDTGELFIMWFIENDELFCNNYKKMHILEKIFNLPYELYDWVFIDGDKYNLHRNNISYSQKNDIKFTSELKIINSYNGKIINNNFKYSLKNQYWLVEENEKQYYILNCSDVLIKLSYNDIDILNTFKKNYWIVSKNNNINDVKNYVHTNILETNSEKLSFKKIFLHKLISSKNNNLELKTFDNINILHINSDIYDNRIENLKLEYKKNRKCNAKILPYIQDCGEKKLPKYVVYYDERYGESEEEKNTKNQEEKKKFIDFRKNKIKNNEEFVDTRKTRQFFKIENHPKIDKVWQSTKSYLKTIEFKYEETINKLTELNNM